MPSREERVLGYEEALAEVLRHAKQVGNAQVDEVDLLEAQGLVLAMELRADRDQPPFPRSTRDGFAVASDDPAWQSGSFKVMGSIRAGEHWTGKDLVAGEAIEIMTGAPVPAGANAVLMLEHATRNEDTLVPERSRQLRPGENVVAQRSEALAGSAVLPAGRRIGAAEIGVAASIGQHTVSVVRRPTVAIVATGDELVEVNAQPEDWQIRNSNSYSLAALVTVVGGIPECLPIARDTMDDLRDRIERGRNADLLLLSGGVSMGKYDLVEQALTEQGAEFIFTGALIQPGKPVVFGKLPARTHPRFGTEQPERYFFGLPGNPISTQVCFHLFVAPLLRALCGETDITPRFAEARLATPVKGGAKVTRFLPAELAGDWQSASVKVVGWQGSGDVTANARGNCYAVFPSGADEFRAGDAVRILLR